MKINFTQMYKINEVINEIASIDKETKLYINAIDFVEESINPVIKQFNKEISRLRVKYALTDKDTGAVLRDSGSIRGYEYSPDSLISLMDAEDKLSDEWDEKMFEVTPIITEVVPVSLTERQRKILKGILI